MFMYGNNLSMNSDVAKYLREEYVQGYYLIEYTEAVAKIK